MDFMNKNDIWYIAVIISILLFSSCNNKKSNQKIDTRVADTPNIVNFILAGCNRIDYSVSALSGSFISEKGTDLKITHPKGLISLDLSNH